MPPPIDRAREKEERTARKKQLAVISKALISKAKADKRLHPSAAEYAKLKRLCIENLKVMCRDLGAYTDSETWIYEKAMELVFGKKVWDMINPHL